MEAARHQLWPALGALLVRGGALTGEELEAALSQQKESGLRLGELLVERGLVTRAAVARALSEQHSLEFVDLGATPIDPEVSSLLSSSLARRYGAVPVRFLDDGALLVAVSDPTNVIHSDDLRLALGVPIRVARRRGGRRRRRDHARRRAGDRARRRRRRRARGCLRRGSTSSTSRTAAGAPAIRQVNRVLRLAIDLGASDVHFNPRGTPSASARASTA